MLSASAKPAGFSSLTMLKRKGAARDASKQFRAKHRKEQLRPENRRLALAGLEAAIGLVDDVEPSAAAHDAAVAMARTQGPQ
jgi:hypothetical protein